MNAADVKELMRLKGWRDEDAAFHLAVSARTIYNWKKLGCSRKGEAKRLRRLLEAAKEKE